jgi:tetratricopeptide (TPR) repeat protein
MNRLIRRAGLATLVAFASAAAIGPMTPAYAAEKKDEGPKVRREVGVPLDDALKLMNAGKLDEAMAKMQEADKVSDKTPFEEYTVAQFLGAIAIRKMDYAGAAAAFNRQVASGGAPDDKKADMYSTAMKLNYQATKDYPKVIQDGVALEKLRPLDETEGLVLTQTYYTTMDYAGAAQSAKNVIATEKAAGKPPAIDLLKMLVNSELKVNDDAGFHAALDQLALVDNGPDVWSQEITNVFQTKGLSDHQLLNIYRLSMLAGTMADQDYQVMATLALKQGLANEAKTILTKGNKTGQLLTQADQLVPKEQASLPELAKEADAAPTGEVLVKLGESYYTYGRYDDAVAALQKGIMKGSLKDAADAETTLGIALLADGKKDEASAAFDKAATMSAIAAPIAHVWSLFARRTVA